MVQVGTEDISPRPDRYSIDGLHPKVVVAPRGVQQLSQAMADAWEERLGVVPWGGGTRAQLGNVLRRLDVVVDTSHLNRIVQHNPEDLTVTVEAGIKMAELQGALVEHGQFLALDPPLPHLASVGGTLAVGASGLLKWRWGHPRDLVLGMKVVQADGEITRSGGQVVKNVSGYDMARLHVGGMGTLGIIAEVSFRLMPLPPHEAKVLAIFDSHERCVEAGLEVFHSHVMPLALATFDGYVNKRGKVIGRDGEFFLAIRLGGRPRTLERQVNECTSLCRQHGASNVEQLNQTDGGSVWRRVADFGWDDDTIPMVAVRATLLPTRVPEFVTIAERSWHTARLRPAILADPGYGSVVINWFTDGEDPSDDDVGEMLTQARRHVHRLGGHLTIERCPTRVKSRFDVWDDVGESLATMRRLKEQYDPKGVLNPGRFLGGI